MDIWEDEGWMYGRMEAGYIGGLRLDVYEESSLTVTWELSGCLFNMRYGNTHTTA